MKLITTRELRTIGFTGVLYVKGSPPEGFDTWLNYERHSEFSYWGSSLGNGAFYFLGLSTSFNSYPQTYLKQIMVTANLVGKKDHVYRRFLGRSTKRQQVSA